MASNEVQQNDPRSVTIEEGSFRDRDGRVFYQDGRVLRALSVQGLSDWHSFSRTQIFGDGQKNGWLINTRLLGDEEARPLLAKLGSSHWAGALEHEPVPVITYPYEWPFSMLQDAALLQLKILRDALTERFTMKDATPYNIAWNGKGLVFIDTPSFERYEQGTPWIGYLQFCKQYLYPLFLQAYRNIPFHGPLRGSLDGIPPEVMLSAMSPVRDLFKPGFLKDVFLQSKLQNHYAGTEAPVRSDLKEVGFDVEMILINVRRLEKVVKQLKWNETKSEWSNYATECSYTQETESEKIAFVTEVLKLRKWRQVLDVGCNTGTYSVIASDHADIVVAVDGDHLAVERLYRRIRQEPKGPGGIIPVVMNFADPSPGLGWNGRERKSFDDRITPDLILCLAVIHHATITANIPLEEFMAYLAGFRCDVVMEFVSKDDEMTKRLLRNREDQYADYTKECFEQYTSRDFTIVERLELQSGTRTLYHLRHRSR